MKRKTLILLVKAYGTTKDIIRTDLDLLPQLQTEFWMIKDSEDEVSECWAITGVKKHGKQKAQKGPRTAQ